MTFFMKKMKTYSAIILSLGMLLLATTTSLAQWEFNDEYQTLKRKVQKAVVNSLRTQPDSCKMRYILIDFKLGKNHKLDSVAFITNVITKDIALMKSKLDTINVKWKALFSKKQMKNSTILMPIVINDLSDYCPLLKVSGSEMFAMMKAMTIANANKGFQQNHCFFSAIGSRILARQ